MANHYEELHAINEKYIDIRQAAELLDVSEEELWNLVRHHKIPTHNVAGAFLRFEKKDIEDLKIKWRIERELFPKKSRYFAHDSTVARPRWFELLADFWYFYDYYIVCSILSAVFLYFIVTSQ